MATAIRLAAAGNQVIAVARHDSAEFRCARDECVRSKTGSLHFWPFDLLEIQRIPELTKAISNEFGPLYGLVNNAGIGTSGVLATMSDTRIEQLLSLNVVSPITLTKYVVRAMMTGSGGRVVNISSIVATHGYSGLSVYSATKAALLGFTHALARELGPIGITVNSVAPGFIATDLTAHADSAALEKIRRRSALRRLAEAEDVAGAVAYLMSNDARNITGTIMTVDAGGTT